MQSGVVMVILTFFQHSYVTTYTFNMSISHSIVYRQVVILAGTTEVSILVMFLFSYLLKKYKHLETDYCVLEKLLKKFPSEPDISSTSKNCHFSTIEISTKAMVKIVFLQNSN